MLSLFSFDHDLSMVCECPFNSQHIFFSLFFLFIICLPSVSVMSDHWDQRIANRLVWSARFSSAFSFCHCANNFLFLFNVLCTKFGLIIEIRVFAYFIQQKFKCVPTGLGWLATNWDEMTFIRKNNSTNLFSEWANFIIFFFKLFLRLVVSLYCQSQ